MSEIIKPGISLFIITLIAAALLGAVSYATEGVITANNEAAKRESMVRVLPDVYDNNFADETITENESGVLAYSAGYGADGNVCGYVFTVLASGYSGKFELLVGIGVDGKVTGVAIGENNETPGLGKNAEKESFTGQFSGKSGILTAVKQTTGGDNEVQAITAATITSKAVTGGVNDALAYFDANLKGDLE